MTTLKCPIAGCTHTVTHKRAGYAAALLGMHKRKVHGIRGGYIKKADREGIPSKPQAESVSAVFPNHCPMCGCELRAIVVALNLRRKS